ncbi:NAD-dependent aldehyde dehydrogenase [SAR116 cluster alpha proteobacterium HIMB100]|nr:NAD-dependent aldehyde dehydrogenase [SAR116 cluster alpha proteobacterium HIMB100]
MNITMSIINGQQLASHLPVFEKRYPATGEVIAKVQPATTDMLDQAVRHAQAAQQDWAKMAAHERARILGRIAGALHQHNEQLSALEVQDVGKVYAEALSADVPSGAEAFEFFASLCATYHGTSHKWPDAIGYTQRVPLGVCAGIGAWNYPVQVACWKAAPALAAGNAFILKPSEETPLTANALAEIFQQAGLPDGLFQVIHGDHEIGQAICAHKGIAKVSLTGGVDTGRLIMAQSAATLKKVTLELGGKAPLLIFADGDFDLAVQTALDANFYTAGEVCSNATRVFVEDSIADAFTQAVTARAADLQIGDPMNPQTQIGALISEPHMRSVLQHIERAKQEGASVLTGGEQVRPMGCADGYFVSPTILGNCTDDMACVKDEIFGPVMSVLTFADEQEAITRANDTAFGLGAGIITSDLSRAHRVADQLQAGNVWINSYNLIPPGLPFGGSKQSGFGREGSVYALEAYTEVKATYVQL